MKNLQSAKRNTKKIEELFRLLSIRSKLEWKKKKKKIRDGERHSPNWFICDDRVSLTCVQSNTKRTADVAGKWTGEYLPFSGEDTWLLDSPTTTLTDILMINLWEKNKKKKEWNDFRRFYRKHAQTSIPRWKRTGTGFAHPCSDVPLETVEVLIHIYLIILTIEWSRLLCRCRDFIAKISPRRNNRINNKQGEGRRRGEYM